MERNDRRADDVAQIHAGATVALAARGMLIADALGRMLREAGLRVVGSYGSLDPLVEKVGRCRPAVVIVDTALDDRAGGAARLLGALRDAGPSSKLVVIAGEVDAALAHAVMAHQACAVILKSTGADDALEIVHQVARGRTHFPAAVLACLGEQRDAGELSARQLEVLEELARGHSNDEIARTLYISVNTVKFHLAAIYERLGVHNRVEAAGALAARRAA